MYTYTGRDHSFPASRHVAKFKTQLCTLKQNILALLIIKITIYYLLKYNFIAKILDPPFLLIFCINCICIM